MNIMNVAQKKDNSGVAIKTEPRECNINASALYSLSECKNEDGSCIKEPIQLCRLCARSAGNMIYIFADSEKGQNLPHKINAYLPVSVKKSDPLPKQLCLPCVTKLKLLSEFAEGSIQAEEKLKHYLKAKLFRSEPISTKTALSEREFSSHSCRNEALEIASTPVASHSNTKYLSIDRHCYSCPLCCFGNMNVQSEDGPNHTFEDILKDDYKSKEKWNCASYGIEKELEESQATDVILSDRMINISPSTIGTSNEDHIEVWGAEDCNLSDIYLENDEGCFRVHQLSKQNENVNIGLNADELVQKLSSSKDNLYCQICGEPFESIDLCLDHSKMHAEPGNYPCPMCGLHLISEPDWLTHSAEHRQKETKKLEDLSKHFLCQECDQIFETYVDFSNHVCLPKRSCKCSDCSNYFMAESRLSFNRNYTNGVVLLCCPLCKKECPNAATYFDHMKMSHPESDELYCQECDKTFVNKSHFMVHLRTVHVEMRSFDCEVCGKQFQSKQVLQGHYVTHMEVKPFQCNYCGIMLARKNSLKQHLLSHHANSIPPQLCYQCNTCKEAFVSLSQALAHTATHTLADDQGSHEIEEVTVSQLYLCEYCDSCYTLTSALIDHYRVHTGENRYICKICNASFSTYGRVSKHRSVHVRLEVEKGDGNINEQFTVPQLFLCLECDKCFPHWTSFCHHRRSRHQANQIHTCKICNENFDKLSQYQEHRKIHNTQIKTEQGLEVSPLKCDQCDKTFNYRSTLVLHQRVHASGQPYVCELCGETFRLKGAYERHFRRHSGAKPYVCEVCGKGFTQNSGLYTHRRVHTGEKPYPCDLCTRRFRLKHDRDNHRRCHTGERPYTCAYCSKAFRTSHDHRQHLLIHTGQRPYRCHYCGKGFRRINGLNVHKRIHTGEKPYGCEMCGRHFTQKGDMMKHRKTQHGISVPKPFIQPLTP